MDYEKFAKILNDKIFKESRADLLRKFAEYPQRYVGLFRPTKPKGKIIQNLTQSAEIKFGDAFEEIIEEYFKESGYNTLPKIFKKEGRKSYSLDQLFERNKTIVFIEQKVRDDHDSTKKRGQIDNFIRKIEILQGTYPNNKIEAIFYFIDDCLNKNKNYYNEEIENIQNDYGLECSLFYGKELFDKYNLSFIWNEILEYLSCWKKDIPDMPQINFDINIDEYFNEIKKVEPNNFRKIFRNDEIFNEMILTISPNKILLTKLLEFFESQSQSLKIYKTLYNELKQKL